jgi:Na+-translocating ferredoxin:NAD+ oxidoreductase RnfC subunit
MKKKFRKLALNTETLRHLEADVLRDVNGATAADTNCTAPGSRCTAPCTLCTACASVCPICPTYTC